MILLFKIVVCLLAALKAFELVIYFFDLFVFSSVWREYRMEKDKQQK